MILLLPAPGGMKIDVLTKEHVCSSFIQNSQKWKQPRCPITDACKTEA